MSTNELEKQAEILGIPIEQVRKKHQEIKSRVSKTGKKSKIDKYDNFIKAAINQGWGNKDIIECIKEQEPTINMKDSSISSRISKIRKQTKPKNNDPAQALHATIQY